MNKKNLLRNTDSSINVSALSAAMAGMRVLVVGDQPPRHPYSQLRPFFDVCIAVDEAAGRYCGNPDILIFTREEPHTNGILDLSRYSEYPNTILCITQHELSIIKKMFKYHSAYVLAWLPVNDSVSNQFISDSAIKYGLNVHDPGRHLALASGAVEVYSRSVRGTTFDQDLDVLIGEKRGYVPKHILRPTRPQFVEEVKLAEPERQIG